MAQASNSTLIKQFVEETIGLAGFGNLPPAFRAQYQEKMETALLKKIGVALNNELTDPQVAALGQFLQNHPNPQPEQLLEFYKERVVGFEEKLSNILRDFQLDFIKNSVAALGGLK